MSQENIESKNIESKNIESKNIESELFKITEYDNSNIYVIENVFDDLFCNDLINIIENIKLQKTDYCNGNNVKCFKIEFKELLNKNYEDTYYYFSTDDNNYNDIINNIKNNKIIYSKEKDLKYIENFITSKLEIIEKKINKKKNIKLINNSGYCLRKIYGKTKNHIDGIISEKIKVIHFLKDDSTSYKFTIRNSSIIIALNDDYKGGEIIFPFQDIKIKLKKGSVLIFPPFWTHPHETNELEDDTYRYTINTWGLDNI